MGAIFNLFQRAALVAADSFITGIATKKAQEASIAILEKQSEIINRLPSGATPLQAAHRVAVKQPKPAVSAESADDREWESAPNPYIGAAAAVELPTTEETITALRQRLIKELYRVELDLQGGGRIAGKPCDCQPGDALVYVAGDHDGNTGKAVLPIKDVYKRKSRFVISHTGEVKRVSSHLSRDFSGLLREINCYYSNIPLRVTSEHPILSLKDARGKFNWRQRGGPKEDICWVKSSDTGVRDLIAFPRIMHTKDMDIITPGFAEVLGWYLAEGSSSVDDAHRIVLSLGKHEKEYIEFINNTIDKIFGAKPCIYERHTSIHICYSHKEFTPIFESFGSNAVNKHLPYWALNLPREKQIRMLRGLFLGDGHFSPTGIHFATISPQLAFQIRLVLYRLGITHSLTKREIQNSEIEGREIISNHPVYFINISGEAAYEFIALANIPHNFTQITKKPHNNGWISEQFVYVPIKSINEQPYEGKVYNLSILGDESYLTPNGAVHNCLSRHKHSVGIEATAEELMSYENNPIYSEIIAWFNQHGPEFEPAVIAQNEPGYYQGLVPEIRNFRKQL